MQLTGVSTEVNAFITPLGGSKYRCTYIPVVPGAYLLHITWNSRQLRGSPYKVSSSFIGLWSFTEMLGLSQALEEFVWTVKR